MMTLDEKRALVEGITRKLLAAIGKDTLDFLKANGFGVTLFASTFGADGAIAYISTVERDDMIRTLKEFIAYQEAGLTTEPRGKRGTS
jgi:hypothetical protein